MCYTECHCDSARHSLMTENLFFHCHNHWGMIFKKYMVEADLFMEDQTGRATLGWPNSALWVF